MAAKPTLNQKIRSVFSHSRRLRLEVLEDRRLLSAVATSTDDDSLAFICGTCESGEDHGHDEDRFVALYEPECVVPDFVPENAVQISSSFDATVTDQIFSDAGNAGVLSVNSTEIALQASGTSRVTNETQLRSALLNVDVSEIIIDSSYNSLQYSTEQIQIRRTLSITSEKSGFTFTGSSDYPLFWVDSEGGNLTLSNVTISGAQFAIYNRGTAKIQNCVIESCNYGIHNIGSIQVQSCIIKSCTYGVYNTGTLVGSQILTYDISSVHFYSAGGTSTLYHCTFSGTGGSTIYAETGTVNLYNSLVTGDTAYMIILFSDGTLNGSGNFVNGSISASGSFAYTRGTPTFETDYSLTPTSVGLNSVQDNANSLDVNGNKLTKDVYGNARKSGSAIDAGAVERQIVVTPLAAPTNVTITPDSSNGSKLTVAWDPVENAASYKVRFKLSHPECETSTWLEKTFTAGTTRWEFELIENTTISTQVIACGDYILSSDSSPSDTVQLTTAAVSFQETLVVNGTAVNVLHLHSNPTATRKIYLDFTGHLTFGTSWNRADYGGDLIVTRTYSRDSSVNFSQSELTEMYKIWKSVAEDYAPFDVDVTTEFLGLDALKRTNYRDEEYGIRVAVGATVQFMELGLQFGGIAYVGSFENSSDVPCFICTDKLEWKAAKEAASHEVGHSVGLFHRGGGSYSSGEYTFGVKISNGQYVSASGYWDSFVWCPIMGASYYTDMTQWSDGSYYNAKWYGSGTDRGDLAVINAYLDYRADDYGDYSTGTITGTPGTLVVAADGTVSTLGDVTLENSDFQYSGIITRQNDTDVFVLELANTSTIDLHIEGSTFANLDVYAALYADSDLQTALLESDEFASLQAEIQISDLAAGTYYLVVDGVGKYDSNGLKYYSDYDSLGYYTIYGSVICTNPLETPVLQFTNVTTSGLTVGWQEITNATGYEVYLNGTLYQTLSSSVTSCVISNLNANTSYTVSVTALTPDEMQYSSSTGSGTQSTLAAPVPAPISMMYGSALPALTFTGGWQAGDVVKYSLTSDGVYSTSAPDFSGKNVGNYTLFLKVERGGLEIWSGSTSVTVSPREIYASEIVWSNDSATYNGQTQSVSASYGGMALNVTVLNGAGTQIADFRNAGTYTASVGVSNSNYKLNSNAQTHTLTMNKYTVSSVSWSIPTLTYTGETQESRVSASFLFNGESKALNFTVSGADVKLRNAGNYTLTADLTDSANFQWAASVANRTVSASIGKYVVTLTEANWGSARSFVYDGQTHTVTAAFMDLVNSGENILSVNSTGTNVGSYTITASLKSGFGSNYTLAGLTSLTVSITPFQVRSINWGTTSLTYNSAVQTLSPMFDFNGQTIALTYTVDGGKILRDAGQYTARAVLTDTQNFVFADDSRSTGVSIAKFTVNQIDWPAYSDLTFTGQTQTIASPTFQFNGTAITLNTSVSKDGLPAELWGAGNYVVTASLADSVNFEFGSGAILSRTVKINPFVITSVTWTDPANLTYTGTEKFVSATFRDCDGQQKALIVTEDSGKTFLNAGTYAFTAAVPSVNYVFQNGVNRHQATITPAVIQALDWTIDSVTWNGSDHRTYDGQTHTAAAGFTFAGQTHEVSVENAQAENAGDYVFTAALMGTLDQQNFRLGASASSKTLTIDRRTLDVQTEISWSATQFTYDGGVHTVSATFTDLKTGQQNALTVTSSPAAIQNAGTYALTAILTPAQTQNYVLSAAATNIAQVMEFEISEIVWNVPNLVYSATVKPISAMFRDCDGQLKALTVTEDSGKTFLNVGSYAFTAVVPGSNYKFAEGAETTKALSITPFIIGSITWDGWEGLTYDGTNHVVTASFTDALGASQFLNVQITGSATALRDAGTYTVNAALGEWAGNYVFDSGLATTKDVTVRPREVTQIMWSDCALTYTGEVQTVTASFQDVTGEAHPLDVTVNDGKTLLNVGVYTVTAAMNDSNYVFAQALETTSNVEIAPFVVTDAAVTWTGVDGLVYNGSAHEAVAYFTFNGQNFALDLSIVVDSTATAEELMNAGTYTLTASLRDSEAQNFELDISPKSVTIAKAKIWASDVTWSGTQFSYDGQTHEVTATAFRSGEPFPAIVLDVTPNEPIQNAGDYTLTASLTHPNFELGEEITHAAKVTPFQIGAIEWGTTTRVYSDTEPVWTLQPTFLDWNGEPVSLTYTVSEGKTLSDAGTYTLTANLPDDAQNYVFTCDDSVQVTITPLQRVVPTDLQAVGIGGGKVLVSWNSADSDFTLEFSRTEDFSESQNTRVTDACETTLDLNPGEIWFLRVRANAGDSNHADSDFSVVFQKLPIDLKGVLAVGTVDPESSAVSEEGIPANASDFYSWDPFNVEVWTESVHELSEGSQVQMTVTLDAEKYLLSDSPEAQISLEGVSLEVTQGAGPNDYVLTFTILEDLNLQGAAAVRLGAVSFTPVSAQHDSLEPAQSLPILIDGAEPDVTPQVTRVCYDMVEDGQIDIQDLVVFARQFGQQSVEPGMFLTGDFNLSGSVEIQDLVWFARNFGLRAGNSEALRFPANYKPVAESTPETGETFIPADVQSTAATPVSTINSRRNLQEMEITVHKTLNEELLEEEEQ